MSNITDKQKATAYDAMQAAKIVEQAKQQGVNEYAAGLARLGAQQAYLDATQGMQQANPSTYFKVGNPYSGQRNFVPAEQVAYANYLTAKNTPQQGLAAVFADPVQIVGDPRVVPNRWQDRSGFGKALEIINAPADKSNVETFGF